MMLTLAELISSPQDLVNLGFHFQNVIVIEMQDNYINQKNLKRGIEQSLST